MPSCLSAQRSVTSRARVAGQDGLAGVESLRLEERAGAAQPIEVPQPHHVAPFGLADRYDLTPDTGLRRSYDGDIDLDLGSVDRVGDNSVAHLAHGLAEGLPAMLAGEVPAQLLKVGTRDSRQEPGAGVLPYRCTGPLLKVSPPGPHYRLVEADQRLGDPVLVPARCESSPAPGRQEPQSSSTLQGVADVGPLAADVVGDTAPVPRLPGGHRG